MGGKTSTSSQQVTIPPEVLARYNAVNANAENVAQTPFQQYSSDPNAFVAPLTSAQNYGLQQTSDYANSAQPGIAAAEQATQAGMSGVTPQALNTQAYMNPYMQQVMQPTEQLMQQQFQQAQSGQLGTAIQSGAFGGDRAGIAAANLQQQQGLAYGQTMGNLLNQNYSQALGAAQQQQGVNLGAQQFNAQQQLAGGAQLGSLAQAGQSAGLAGAQALMSAGQVQQQTQQAGLTALYNQFLQQQSYPFQTAQFLANIAEGTGALSGQTTTTTQPSSFFSDRRLKEDIKHVGTAKNGLPIYSFRYKGDPDKLTRLGFMADEVEKKHPEAVGLAGGFKTVDYDRAARASGGGLVTDDDAGATYARGGFDVGGVAYPDWSRLTQAEAAMYGQNAGGADRATDGSPYGGHARVPQSQQSQHKMLQPGQMPKPQENGMQQAMQGVGQLEKLGSLAKGAQGLAGKLPGMGGSSAPAASPAAPPAADAPVPAPDVPTPPPRPDDLSGHAVSDAGDASGLAAGDAAVADAGGADGLLDLSGMFAAQGGRIGRAAGGMSPGEAATTPQLFDAVARQNALPTWNGPFAQGGLAGREHFDAGGAPVVTGAPTHGPDVVSPTEAYLSGLGEAQAAQQRANDLQDQQRAHLASLGISASPDLTPAGQFYDNMALGQSMMAQGEQGIYSPSYSHQLFARGGLAGRGHFGVGGSPDTGAWDSADHEYQGGDDDSTQDTTRMGIPDEKPNVEPLKPSNPPSQGSGGGMGGISQGIGALTGLLGLFLKTGGRVPRRRGGLADGGVPDDIVGAPDSPDLQNRMLFDPTIGDPAPDQIGEIPRMLPAEGKSAPTPATGFHSLPHSSMVDELPSAWHGADTSEANPTGGATLDAPTPAGLAGADDVLARRRAAHDTSEELGPSPALAKMGSGLAPASAPTPDSPDVPLPPPRPAGLGGGEAPDATPAPDEPNPVVRAGNAVSGAITRGVEGAGRAVQSGLQDAGSFVNRVVHYETNGRNIYSGVDHNGGPWGDAGRSQGYFQISTPTWHEFAAKAGIDVNKYPDAMHAPFEVQQQMASVIPMGRWGPRTLRGLQSDGWTIDKHKTLGENAAMNGGSSGAKGMSDNSDSVNALRIAGVPARNFQAQASSDGGDDGYSDNYGGGQGGNDVVNSGMGVAHAATKGGPNWFDENRSWMIPLLTGLGGMASSNSRYLGSAILQGMGTGAQAYANERASEADLGRKYADIGHVQAGTGLTQAQTRLTGAHTLDANLAASKVYQEIVQSQGIPINGIMYRPVKFKNGSEGMLREQDIPQYIQSGDIVGPGTPALANGAGNAFKQPALSGQPPVAGGGGGAPASGGAPAAGTTPSPSVPGVHGAPGTPNFAPSPTPPGINTGRGALSQSDTLKAHGDVYGLRMDDPAVKAGHDYRESIAAGANDARQNLRNDWLTARLASKMANNKGVEEPGAMQAFLGTKLAYLNNLSRDMGVGDFFKGVTTEGALAQKYAEFRSLDAVKHAGQQSLAALEHFNNVATVNPLEHPEVMSELASYNIVNDAKAIDADRWAQNYGVASGGTYARLPANLNAALPHAQYAKDQQTLAAMIRSRPDLVERYMNPSVNRDKLDAGFEAAGYGKQFGRYFYGEK